MVLFFVLQIKNIVLAINNYLNVLKINTLERYLSEIQFSVSGSGFSVLFSVLVKFNSLYPAPVSLKMKK
jgi:hypothetical protein